MQRKEFVIEYLASSLLLERLEYVPEPVPHFIWKKGQCKGKKAGSKRIDGYRSFKVSLGERHFHAHIWEHRLMWFYHHSHIADGEIDHINGVRDDNRIENLRITTARGNSRNAKRHRDGHLWGTTFHANRWRASVTVNNKRIDLGRYKTQLEAHQVALKYSKDNNLQ